MTDRQPLTLETMIVDKIDTLNVTLNQRLDAQEREVDRRFTEQDKTLAAIKTQTEKTNGRVTALEKARERAQGVLFAVSWVPEILVAVLTAGLTILIMALTGSIQ